MFAINIIKKVYFLNRENKHIVLLHKTEIITSTHTIKKMTTKHLVFSVVLAIVFTTNTKAAPTDSIRFMCEKEKDLLLNFSNGKEIDLFDLFASLNQTNTTEINKLKTSITDHIKELDKTGLDKKNTKQKVQIIYKLTYKKFFKHYTPNSTFNELFESGNYSCIPATTLFALILNHFKINYTIKNNSNHVFIEVKDGADSIPMESTVLQDGVYNYPNEFKREYINILAKNNGLQSEDRQLPIEDAFSKYYYSNGEIDIYQLAGLQYFNAGLSEIEESAYEDALYNFEKSKILHKKNPSIDYLINICVLGMLNNGSNDAAILSKLINACKKNTDNLKPAEYFFDNISKALINSDSNLTKYNAYFNQLKTNVADTAIMAKLYFRYYLYCGHYYEVNGNIAKAVDYVGKSYSLYPTNLDAKKTLLALIDKHLKEIGLRGDGIIGIIENYYSRFPFLKEYNNINDFRIAIYACGIMDNLIRKDIVTASKYLPGFENSFTDIKHNENTMFTIGEVYGDLYRFYLTRNNTEKAKYYLKRGYTFSPNNLVLRNYEQKLIRK